jgi:hypothetical protein
MNETVTRVSMRENPRHIAGYIETYFLKLRSYSHAAELAEKRELCGSLELRCLFDQRYLILLQNFVAGGFTYS